MNRIFMQRRVIQKVDNPELLLLFVTDCHNEINIIIKFHKNIPKG